MANARIYEVAKTIATLSKPSNQGKRYNNQCTDTEPSDKLMLNTVNIVTVWTTIYVVWIGNWIYWTLRDLNYKYL
jgi:hypothetical protein